MIAEEAIQLHSVLSAYLTYTRRVVHIPSRRPRVHHCAERQCESPAHDVSRECPPIWIARCFVAVMS